MEIRLHGRGGQGGVTCAKILAAVYARTGKSVQTFGDYAGERSGAPVRAYARVSDDQITDRNKVYRPAHVVVLDPTLLDEEAVAGMLGGGALLVNTCASLDDLAARYRNVALGAVDATGIARRHGIGSRSVVIVNTTITGAYARMHDLSFELLEETYRELGYGRDLPAAREAYEAVRLRGAPSGPAVGAPPPPPPRPAVEDLTAHVDGPPPPVRTGSWRQQEPRYVAGLAPCNAWCPAGNDVVGFVQALATSGEQAAASVLARSNPLAAVCGRVCPAPCMEGCNRREHDGAVNIRGLERWVADRAFTAEPAPIKRVAPRRVAVVGGGPAGLSAAYVLARAGHAVTLFDREPELGGVLRTGIPTFRLPRDVLDRDVEGILSLGIETRCGTVVDGAALRDLVASHEGVVLATGLQRLQRLDIPGADLHGVEQGLQHLHRLNAGRGSPLQGRVVVLGGGNTAIDCARSALRAGATDVLVVYRRTRAEMPAIREEVEQAADEGVAFEFQRQPVAVLGDGRVAGIEVAEVEMGPPDASGRRRPVVTGRRRRIDCDLVILALGQSADLSLLPPGWRLADGRLWDGEAPLACFAAGDVVTGDGTVTHAVGDGRRAAGRLLRALGEPVEPFHRPPIEEAVRATDIHFDRFPSSMPAFEGATSPPLRARTFDEVNLGLASAREAERCLSCGTCTRCDTCLVYCPEGSLRRTDDGYAVDYAACKGCGLCVAECPRHAMEMVSR